MTVAKTKLRAYDGSRCRRALELHDRGLSWREVGEAMGVKKSSAAQMARHARLHPNGRTRREAAPSPVDVALDARFDARPCPRCHLRGPHVCISSLATAAGPGFSW